MTTPESLVNGGWLPNFSSNNWDVFQSPEKLRAILNAVLATPDLNEAHLVLLNNREFYARIQQNATVKQWVTDNLNNPNISDEKKKFLIGWIDVIDDIPLNVVRDVLGRWQHIIYNRGLMILLNNVSYILYKV